ncbi:MAG: hypothetical protein JWQ03_2898 [Variovorax sp.]|nr:hypothetical protein [Variovorax sp.]
MKTSNFIAAASLSLLAAVGAQAETYEGVHPPTSQNARADVAAEAMLAARSVNPYAEGASAGVLPALTASADRDSVRAEARDAARAANQNLDNEGHAAFANSVIPSQFTKRGASVMRQAAL